MPSGLCDDTRGVSNDVATKGNSAVEAADGTLLEGPATRDLTAQVSHLTP
jgi:hypothetical protein